eukprot:GCRY01004508.1.p1 GENE.GCRY01004508.1~~GCRY01004508.1.p1  ORF type:complete len:306 (+),score=80.07 GCRY01004508.1:854-1771(+)
MLRQSLGNPNIFASASLQPEGKCKLLVSSSSSSSSSENYMWMTGHWSACTAACNTGTHTRDVSCIDTETKASVESAYCDVATKPETSEECNTFNCTAVTNYAYLSTGVTPSSNYPDTALYLTDGVRASSYLSTGAVGFNDNPDHGEAQPAILFALENSKTLRRISISYNVASGAGVYPPESMKVSVSSDPIADASTEALQKISPNYQVENSVGSDTFSTTADNAALTVIVPLDCSPMTTATYVKVEFFSTKSWVFLSEIAFADEPDSSSSSSGGLISPDSSENPASFIRPQYLFSLLILLAWLMY